MKVKKVINIYTNDDFMEYSVDHNFCWIYNYKFITDPYSKEIILLNLINPHNVDSF